MMKKAELIAVWELTFSGISTMNYFVVCGRNQVAYSVFHPSSEQRFIKLVYQEEMHCI